MTSEGSWASTAPERALRYFTSDTMAEGMHAPVPEFMPESTLGL